MNEETSAIADEDGVVDRECVEFQRAWRSSSAVQEQLEARLRFEQLLTDISAAFINLPADRIDSAIDGVLRRLLETLEHDRSSLAEFSRDQQLAVVTHSCAVPGIKPFPLGVAVDERLPWYVRQLRTGKMLCLRQLPDDLPPEAVQERQHCIAEGIRATLAIPLHVGGLALGIVSFSFLRRPCAWSADFMGRLRVIGEILANALARKQSDVALQAALTENVRLRERLEQENLYLREKVVVTRHHARIVGQSDAIRRALSLAERVAPTDTPVLLLGETGTGKELLAQTVHELSARKDRPMITVNCASLPPTLVESELFGREAGAYTGALTAQVGRFVLADGSTLFLDEIGELPLDLQAKLLRVLQDGRFERLGSPKTITVNVRIIAATNRDLEKGLSEGTFRADLYHRLNVFPVRLPPLRERHGDIPALVWAFVDSIGRRMSKIIKSIPRGVMEQLQEYDWPGNVRELSNVVERAMILTSGSTLRIELPAIGRAARPRTQPQ
jgi:transcriptional regulator with GAF, ATPase, and Fis domain